MMQEITIKIDDSVLERLAFEVKNRRSQCASNSVSDVFLIRMLESIKNNKLSMSISTENKRLMVKTTVKQ